MQFFHEWSKIVENTHFYVQIHSGVNSPASPMKNQPYNLCYVLFLHVCRTIVQQGLCLVSHQALFFLFITRYQVQRLTNLMINLTIYYWGAINNFPQALVLVNNFLLMVVLVYSGLYGGVLAILGVFGYF